MPFCTQHPIWENTHMYTLHTDVQPMHTDIQYILSHPCTQTHIILCAGSFPLSLLAWSAERPRTTSPCSVVTGTVWV